MLVMEQGLSPTPKLAAKLKFREAVMLRPVKTVISATVEVNVVVLCALGQASYHAKRV